MFNGAAATPEFTRWWSIEASAYKLNHLLKGINEDKPPGGYSVTSDPTCKHGWLLDLRKNDLCLLDYCIFTLKQKELKVNMFHLHVLTRMLSHAALHDEILRVTWPFTCSPKKQRAKDCLREKMNLSLLRKSDSALRERSGLSLTAGSEPVTREEVWPRQRVRSSPLCADWSVRAGSLQLGLPQRPTTPDSTPECVCVCVRQTRQPVCTKAQPTKRVDTCNRFSFLFFLLLPFFLMASRGDFRKNSQHPSLLQTACVWFSHCRWSFHLSLDRCDAESRSWGFPRCD